MGLAWYRAGAPRYVSIFLVTKDHSSFPLRNIVFISFATASC